MLLSGKRTSIVSGARPTRDEAMPAEHFDVPPPARQKTGQLILALSYPARSSHFVNIAATRTRRHSSGDRPHGAAIRRPGARLPRGSRIGVALHADAVRMLRNKSADGLAASTWWLKLTSYTCTDVYNIRNGFPLSAFSETLVITVEATIILALVNYFQKRINVLTIAMALTYLVLSAWALLSPSNKLPWGPPDGWIDSAQILATVINVFALVPQLKQNWERGESGDYSPISALLASAGCAVRIFTTVQLAGGDPLLLLNYGVALLLNLSVLFQIVYFGTRKEGKSLMDLFLADVRDSEKVVNAKQLAEETF